MRRKICNEKNVKKIRITRYDLTFASLQSLNWKSSIYNWKVIENATLKSVLAINTRMQNEMNRGWPSVMALKSSNTMANYRTIAV